MPSRLYDRQRWHRFRRQYRIAHPLCEECLKAGLVVPSAHVDHITLIEKGGAEYDEANLQALCKPCHSKKTIADYGGKPREFIAGCSTTGIPIDQRHPWNRSRNGS